MNSNQRYCYSNLF